MYFQGTAEIDEMSDHQAAGTDEMSDQRADSDSEVNIYLVVLMYNFQESITESNCNTVTKDAIEQSNKLLTSHSNWVESQLKV